jgi:succinoglycan biosynthesis transport protein ExoP
LKFSDRFSMATDYELTFFDYLSIIRRRARYLIGIFALALLITIFVSFTIPTTYKSTGTIMVETHLVADNIVPSAIKNQLDERINLIKQKIMTRDSLFQIANKYNVFKGQPANLTSDELSEKMRKQIVVEPAVSETIRTNQQGLPISAFTISFEDRDPKVAFDVTNEIISLFLDWNVKLRTEGAKETKTFLSGETDKLKTEVESLDEQISQYKQKHKNALPEQLTLRMTMLSRAENDLREVERDIRSTKEEVRSLEVELSASRHDGDDKLQTLPALKAEYARLSAIYNESHPDLRRLKRKINALESQMEPTQKKSDVALSDTSNLAALKLQGKIDSDISRLSSLDEQKKMLEATIAENQSAMIETPRVGEGLDVLLRDRDIAQKKYDEIRNKTMNAQIAENLESESMSEHFKVLEQPLLPEKPFKPDRLKIFALGLFFAVISSAGGIMALESIDKRIHGVEALTFVLGFQPLAVIPYLQNQEDEVRIGHFYKLAKITVIVLLFVVAVALHFFYMPLDIMLMNMLAKIM